MYFSEPLAISSTLQIGFDGKPVNIGLMQSAQIQMSDSLDHASLLLDSSDITRVTRQAFDVAKSFLSHHASHDDNKTNIIDAFDKFIAPLNQFIKINDKNLQSNLNHLNEATNNETSTLSLN